MRVCCPRCLFKYRDVRADGSKTSHACEVVTTVIVNRDGVIRDVPPALVEATDDVIERRTFAVADIDGQTLTRQLKREPDDVAPARSRGSRSSRPRPSRSKKSPSPAAL